MGLRLVVGGWSRGQLGRDCASGQRFVVPGWGQRDWQCVSGLCASGVRFVVARVGSAGRGIGCRDCLSFLLVRECRIAGLLYKIAGLLYKISGLLCIKISGLLCIKISGLLCMRFAVGERGECEKMAW